MVVRRWVVELAFYCEEAEEEDDEGPDGRSLHLENILFDREVYSRRILY